MSELERAARLAFAPTELAYLDTPSMGRPTLGTADAVTTAIASWVTAEANFADWETCIDESRTLWARHANVDVSNVGAIPSITTPLASIFAQAALTDGDLLIHADEFRSLALPAIAAFGTDRVRTIEGAYTVATFSAALDRSVACLAVSSVSSSDGARLDLRTLAEAADSVGAHLVIDSTQSEGIVPLGLDYAACAAVVTAAYKGLLSPRGTGFVHTTDAFLQRSNTAPSPYGMADNWVRGSYGGPVDPFVGGRGLSQSPAWLSWVGTGESLRWLDALPLEQRAAHSLRLSGRLTAALANVGVVTQETDLPSSIVSVAVQDADAVARELQQAGIRAAIRLGRLRLGTHIYNSNDDIDRALETLLGPVLPFLERTTS